MTINELKLQIIQGNLNNLFAFYGIESTVQNVYVHKIAEVTNSQLCYIDSIAEAFNEDDGFLFEDKKCYVCINPSEILKSSDLEKEFEKIVNKIGSNLLILQFTKLDKRSKLYNFIEKHKDKEYHCAFIEFEQLHPIVITKHLQEKLDISQAVADKLIEVCEYDYGRCLLELDKVKQYDLESPNKAFKVLLDNKVIYEPPGDKIFDFVSAVLSGKPKLSFRLLQECKDIGEPSLRLLLVLFTNIKHLLQVQACQGNIADTTGLTSWEIRNVQGYQGVYRNYELIDALELIRKVEKGIKIGQIDEQIAVDYVLVNLF